MTTPGLTDSPDVSLFDALLLCGDTGIVAEEGESAEESVFVFPPFFAGGASSLLGCPWLYLPSLEDWELGCSTAYCVSNSWRYLIEDDSSTSSSEDESMAPAAGFVDPYHVLQVRRDATPLEIRRAYMRLALWHSPGRSTMDLVSPRERARRRQVFEVLAACYETLVDKPTRVRFDALLKEAEAEPAGTVGTAPSSQSQLISRASQGLDPRGLGTKPTARQTAVEIPSLSTVSVDSSSSSSDNEGSIDSDNDVTVSVSHESHRKAGAEGAKVCGDISLCHSRESVQPRQKHARKKKQSKSDTSSSHYAKSLRQFLFGVAPSISVEDDDDDEEDPEQRSVQLHLDGTSKGRRGAVARKRLGRTFTPMPQPSSSSSAEEEVHYSERETNRLFGGPLTLLFRARQWRPLTDPHEVFRGVFGSDMRSASSGPGSQSSAHLIRALQPTSPAAVVPIRPSAPTSWTTTTTTASANQGTNASPTETVPTQTVVCTTTRVLNDRVLTRTETIRQELGGPSRRRRRQKGLAGSDDGAGDAGARTRRSRQITVTSEPIYPPEGGPDRSSSSWCGSWGPWSAGASDCDFQLCLWE